MTDERNGMDTTYRTDEYRGCTIKLAGEEYSGDMNPRERGMALICQVAAVNDYDSPRRGEAGHLADEWAPVITRSWVDRDEFEVDCTECNGAGTVELGDGETDDDGYPVGAMRDDGFYATTKDCPTCKGESYVTVGLIEYVKREHAAVAVVPLRYSDYGSSGCRVDPCDEEDANLVAFTTRSELDECGRPLNADGTEQDLVAAIESEIDYWESWLNGDVSYWVTEDEDGDTIDSCGGFIGSDNDTEDYMLSEARSSIDYFIEERDKEAAAVAYWASRDIETVAR